MVIRNMKRGCGKRKKGGVYAEVELEEPGMGQPLEHFLLDPVPPIDPIKLKLSTRKPVLRLYEQSGIYAIMDWVGESHYPNICDWLEETRRMGLSRRMDLSEDEYKLLIPNNPIIMVFNRAWMSREALEHYYNQMMPMDEIGYRWDYCPKNNDHSGKIINLSKMINCAGLHWNRVDIGSNPIDDDPRYVTRKVGSIEYKAARSPDSALDLPPDLFMPGAVAMFYLTRLTVVASEDGSHEDKLAKLENVNIPVELSEV